MRSEFRREADALEDGGGFGASEVIEEGLGGLGMLADVQYGSGVDDLAAHVLRGGVHDRETRAEGVGGVYDAAVHAGLGDLGGDLLDVGAVGDETLGGQLLLLQFVEGEDLLRVLADGHVAVAHGEEDVAGLERLDQLVKALDALGIALGDDQGDLVLQQIHAAALQHEVEPVGVLLRVAGYVERVHLLGSGGNEQIAFRTLLDLGLQRAGGVEVVSDGHAGIGGLVHGLDLRHRLGHRGGGEDDELDLFRRGRGLFGGSRLSGFGLLCRLFGRRSGCRGRGLSAAGCQRKDHAERQQQCWDFFHFFCLLFPFFREMYLYKHGFTCSYTDEKKKKGESSEGVAPLIFVRRRKHIRSFFAGACTSRKTLLGLQVCERLTQASARGQAAAPAFKAL